MIERICHIDNNLEDSIFLFGARQTGKSTFLRQKYPDSIYIGKGVRITAGTKILTHYLDPSQPGVHFRRGEVHIEDDVFIGLNVCICSSVTIGKGAIIGAGSVVTKDIPPYQVWAGNPARYIKDRAK